jgi:nicotinate-nucleotide pyrophosphorylase (carboxylating)
VNSSPVYLDLFQRRLSWNDLNTAHTADLIKSAISEDLGCTVDTINRAWENDLTSNTCRFTGRGKAILRARENLVVCGLPLIPMIIDVVGCDDLSFSANAADGDYLPLNSIIGTLNGASHQILALERTILNFVQKLSGIATDTKKFVDLASTHNVGLLDTRKTTPGYRMLEKYACAKGGAFNHRTGLFDRILIKDNHLASQSIENTSELALYLNRLKAELPEVLIELEIDHPDQLMPAIQSGVDAVLLDNFEPDQVKQAVHLNQNRIILEASGKINIDNIEIYARQKPHFISTGAPVHRSNWIDIGLDWQFV